MEWSIAYFLYAIQTTPLGLFNPGSSDNLPIKSPPPIPQKNEGMT